MSISLYPSVLLRGDEIEDVASEEIDDICQRLHDAMKGFGTNEKALVDVLGSLTVDQRCFVYIRYEQLFEKRLYDVVRGETGRRSSFGQALQYLSVNPVMTECAMIRDSCQGAGTNEYLLLTVICSRTNEEIELLKKKYFEMFNTDLGSVLSSELNRSLEQLSLNCLQGMEEEYDSDTYDDDRMQQDMKKLHGMGEGKFGTDETGMFKIICAAPPQYLKKMDIEYAKEYGNTLHKALENELDGVVQDAALFLFGMKTKPVETVAGLIHKSVKGFGTNEDLLSVTLIRYGKIINDVKLAYVEQYGKTIADTIRDEVGGDQEELLLRVIGEYEEK